MTRTRWLLAGLLLAGLGLRLWSIRSGLPWVYNRDEETHFVPVAVRMFGGDLNPHYFENPPALTYLLYAIFRVRFHGGLQHAFSVNPTAAFETARVVVALISTASVALVYWAGVRWFDDRRVGLLAAGLLAFGFLPAFYGKFALNDAVTLAPAAIALALIALAWDRGRWWMWAGAGAAIGVATAVKYTAGAMLLPLAIALVMQAWDADPEAARGARIRAAIVPVLRGGLAAGIAFVVAFLILNPYSIADFATFRHQVAGQSATAGGSAKLGQSSTPGWLYYLWTLTWGLGWVPTIAAIGGAVLLLRENWKRGLVLVVFPLFMFLFLGAQARHFGRWFMPAYPALVLLAGYGAIRAADWVGRGRRWAQWALAAIVVAMLVQGLAATIRVDAVLARNDTRFLARSWILDNIPPDAKLVVEPFVPRKWLPSDRLYPIKPPFQAYEKKLDASLIDTYRAGHYCWVVVGSHQKQRGLKADLPGAIAYYKRLNRESDQTQLFDPWRSGADRPGFNFDMSFDYYPTAFVRPGPLVEVHHLRGCK
ncbi:MAG TPA: glycosyltransferase family 39 protein [Thermoleophilaceae bacterium]|nr:glycosyltransferase family 39 protein [Thermoleophilaceae bacterium]